MAEYKVERDDRIIEVETFQKPERYATQMQVSNMAEPALQGTNETKKARKVRINTAHVSLDEVAQTWGEDVAEAISEEYE